MTEKAFTGDKKLPMRSLLAGPERKFIDANVTRFPRWLEGYHLTMTTVLWSAGLIFFGYMAQGNIHWLWASSGMLFMQWFTDSFDGALGRHRDTGIPKWGYYMDHLLDFVFMCSILIGYSFLFDGFDKEIVYLLVPIFGCFMVSPYLAFGATAEFKITYMGLGPTEIRIFFAILNCFLIWLGTAWLQNVLLYVLIVSLLLLCVIIYRTQKYIWGVDMKNKQPAPTSK